METKNNNVVYLTKYLEQKVELKTFNPSDIQFFPLSKDKIMKRRIYSFAVDFSTIMLINTAIHVSYSVFINNFFLIFNNEQKLHLTTSHFALQMSVFLLIYATYFFYGQYVLNGQTLGKMLFNLRTISDDFAFDEKAQNYSPTLREAWRRTFGYLVCYLSFGSFFIFSIMSEDKRGLPDYFSKTRTVSQEWLDGMIAFKQYEHEEVRIDISELDKVA